jgi:hypothetical protein
MNFAAIDLLGTKQCDVELFLLLHGSKQLTQTMKLLSAFAMIAFERRLLPN